MNKCDFCIHGTECGNSPYRTGYVVGSWAGGSSCQEATQAFRDYMNNRNTRTYNKNVNVNKNVNKNVNVNQHRKPIIRNK